MSVLLVANSCEQKHQLVSEPAPAVDEPQAGSPPPSQTELVKIAKRFARDAGIPNLIDIKIPSGQSELRIWKGGGLVTSRCFSLRLKGSRAVAKKLRVRVRRHNGDVTFHYSNHLLPPPKSGWEGLLAKLREGGIDTSVNLKLDPTYLYDPDIESLLIEMKTGSHYTISYYLDSTRTADGQRAFSLCRNIEQEFNTRIGCETY